MSDLLTRPRAAPRPRPAESGGWASSALGGALWAAALGLTGAVVLAVVAWAADPRSSAGAEQAARAGMALWLLAGHARLGVAGGTLGLVPLGFAAVPLLLLARAGAGVARDAGIAGLAEAGRATVALAAPYALLAGLVAQFAAVPGLRPSGVTAGLGAAGTALVGGGIGVLRGAGLLGAPLAALPARCRRALIAGTVGALGLLGAGALAAAVAVGLSAGRLGAGAATLDAGAVGVLVLAAVSLALAPNAAVAAVGWLAGPGFAVGTGGVGPFAVSPGTLPALPVFAAVPAGSPPAALGAVLVVPLLVGALTGCCAVRGRRGGVLAGALDAAAAGAVGGLLLALAAALAGGPLGPMLPAVGPSPWQVGLAVAGELAVGGALTAAVLRWRGWAAG